MKLEAQIYFEGSAITKIPAGYYMVTGGYSYTPGSRQIFKKSGATLINPDWTVAPLPPMLRHHYNHCTVWHKGYVYVFG